VTKGAVEALTKVLALEDYTEQLSQTELIQGVGQLLPTIRREGDGDACRHVIGHWASCHHQVAHGQLYVLHQNERAGRLPKEADDVARSRNRQEALLVTDEDRTIAIEAAENFTHLIARADEREILD
jgi:hypothetical protein